MQRSCDVCGAAYEAKRPTSRYCGGTCRTRASRKGRTAKVTRLAAVAPAAATDAGDLEQAVLAELRAQSVDHTAAGQAALALARRVDGGTEQAAPLVRGMFEALDRVLKTQPTQSRLEQLRARRGA